MILSRIAEGLRAALGSRAVEAGLRVATKEGAEAAGTAARLSRVAEPARALRPNQLPHFRYSLEGMPFHVWGRELSEAEQAAYGAVVRNFNEAVPGALDSVPKVRIWADPDKAAGKSFEDSVFNRFWRGLSDEGRERLNPSLKPGWSFDSQKLSNGLTGNYTAREMPMREIIMDKEGPRLINRYSTSGQISIYDWFPKTSNYSVGGGDPAVTLAHEFGHAMTMRNEGPGIHSFLPHYRQLQEARQTPLMRYVAQNMDSMPIGLGQIYTQHERFLQGAPVRKVLSATIEEQDHGLVQDFARRYGAGISGYATTDAREATAEAMAARYGGQSSVLDFRGNILADTAERHRINETARLTQEFFEKKHNLIMNPQDALIEYAKESQAVRAARSGRIRSGVTQSLPAHNASLLRLQELPGRLRQ